MSNYWLKLYIEILDDPKIGPLPDYLWRRWIEILLIAKEHDKGGLLPPVSAMAWRLRADEGRLTKDLRALSQIGVVTLSEPGWFIPAFAERQAASPDKERAREYRKRKAAEREENPSRNVTPESETDTELKEYEEEKPPPRPNSFKLYEQAIGTLTTTIAEKLKAAEKDYPPEWIAWAFDVAATQNKRSWAYVEACLRNRKDGKEFAPRGNGKNGNGRKPTVNEPAGYAAIRQYCEEENIPCPV